MVSSYPPLRKTPSALAVTSASKTPERDDFRMNRHRALFVV
jgi:hypothetical protein